MVKANDPVLWDGANIISDMACSGALQNVSALACRMPLNNYKGLVVMVMKFIHGPISASFGVLRMAFDNRPVCTGMKHSAFLNNETISSCPSSSSLQRMARLIALDKCCRYSSRFSVWLLHGCEMRCIRVLEQLLKIWVEMQLTIFVFIVQIYSTTT